MQLHFTAFNMLNLLLFRRFIQMAIWLHSITFRRIFPHCNNGLAQYGSTAESQSKRLDTCFSPLSLGFNTGLLNVKFVLDDAKFCLLPPHIHAHLLPRANTDRAAPCQSWHSTCLTWHCTWHWVGKLSFVPAYLQCRHAQQETQIECFLCNKYAMET